MGNDRLYSVQIIRVASMHQVPQLGLAQQVRRKYMMMELWIIILEVLITGIVTVNTCLLSMWVLMCIWIFLTEMR